MTAPYWSSLRWRSLCWSSRMLWVLLLAPGCGSATATVPERPRPKPEQPPVRVSYPPPPAKVEKLPLRRDEDCLWRDGYWDSRGSEWHWVNGQWLRVAPGCVYSPPRTSFEKTASGRALVYRPGEWFRPGTGESCERPPACSADAG